MASALDVLGSLLQGGMSSSTPTRIQSALSESGVGGSGGILNQILGRSPQTTSASSAGGLGDVLSSVLGGGGSGLKAGGLGALAGAVLGGGAKGAVGGGALALLGSMALQALRGAGGKQPEPSQLDPTARLAAGLRSPTNQQEEKQVESVAHLIVRSMINAAKADGNIDEREVQRIVGNLGKTGGAEATDEIVKEFRKPMDTDSIVRAVPNPQVAAEVYAASLLAVDLDTEAEKEYMEELADKLHLDDGVVRKLHEVVGAS